MPWCSNVFQCLTWQVVVENASGIPEGSILPHCLALAFSATPLFFFQTVGSFSDVAGPSVLATSDGKARFPPTSQWKPKWLPSRNVLGCSVVSIRDCLFEVQFTQTSLLDACPFKVDLFAPLGSSRLVPARETWNVQGTTVLVDQFSARS